MRLVSESCFLVLGLRQPSMQSDRTSHLQHQKPCRISLDFLGFRWKTIFASGNHFLYKPILTSDFIGKLLYIYIYIICAPGVSVLFSALRLHIWKAAASTNAAQHFESETWEQARWRCEKFPFFGAGFSRKTAPDGIRRKNRFSDVRIGFPTGSDGFRRTFRRCFLKIWF